MAPPSSKPRAERPPKRVRPAPPTFEKAKEPDTFSRFLVLHAANDSLPLSKMSPFLVSKVLEQTIGKNYKAKKLAGDLLVEVENKTQSTALLKLTSLGEHQVCVTPHRTLNTLRGVISEDDLLQCTEEEILEGLRRSAVVAVRRITLRRDGQEIPTRHLVLTFELHSLPSTVKAGYLNCRVRPFVPNPQRCFRCQRFGHGSRNCRGRETCAKCSATDHVADICENNHKCINCGGPHPAFSRTCPKWKKEKEIITFKVKHNLSYQDAREQLAFKARGSYAEAVRRGPPLSMASVETQTSPEDLSSPQGSFYVRPKTVGNPLPSCSNEFIVPSKEGAAPSKEPDVSSPALAGPSGRGRGLPPRASGSSSKPGRSDSPLPPKGPKVSLDEKMDVSVPLSDEDLPLSQTGSVSSASCEAGGRPKDTAKKKTIPRIVAPKDA